MAPGAAMGSYEHYKLDTKRYVFWLVNTARGFGYNIRDPACILQEKMRQQPSMRLKGKAASNAKYSIPAEKMLELAEYIGKQNMTAPMPKFIWIPYQHAIKTGEAYAQRYAKE